MEHSTTPSKSLPWNDVNLLVVTDVHSWIAGHGEHPEENLNADYGDVLSLYRRLQQLQSKENHNNSNNGDFADLFFVMNGDFMDGTGLSTIPPQHLTPLLQKMPWNAINVGNHELYFDETVQHLISSGFIDHWNGTYLSSNTLVAKTHRPLGHRYTFLHGQYSNTTLLTFGFLYNFQGHCASTLVERVEDVVEQRWFRKVLVHPTEPYQAILVLAHMDCVDSLVTVLLHAIRDQVGPTIPILFITGHSHRRAFVRLDDHAVSFEAGRYLDTVGWISFSLPTDEQHSTTMFEYRFLDANKQSLYKAVGAKSKDKFETAEGIALRKLIHHTQKSLGLHEILGCSSRTYSLEAGFESSYQNPSLWGLYVNEVIPKQLLEKIKTQNTSIKPIFVQGTGVLRYSLISGKITRDDVIAVCPFNDTIYEFDYLLKGHELQQVLDHLEQQYSAYNKYSMPSFATIPPTIEANYTYQLLVPDFEYKRLSPYLDNITKNEKNRSKNPKAVCVRGRCLYTTDLWMTYVKEELPCLLMDQYVTDQNGKSLLDLSGDRLPMNMMEMDHVQQTALPLFVALAGLVLAMVFTTRLTATIVQKQQQQRESRKERTALIGASAELLELDAACSDYGTITGRVEGNTSSVGFSRAQFYVSAKALAAALQSQKNTDSTLCSSQFRLSDWEVVSDPDSTGTTFLCHPPILLSGLCRTNGPVTEPLDEIALEDPSVVIEDTSNIENPFHDVNATFWAFSIVYSETYCVPVLYFHVQDCHGKPLGRQRVLSLLRHVQTNNTSEPFPEDTWEFVSQEQHPITFMPSFFLHPCQSSQRLQLLLMCEMDKEGQCNVESCMLWAWMSMILPAVGFPIPPRFFQSVQSKLNKLHS